MNYKTSLAALAVASVVSGQAMAALTPAENTALAALAPDSTWTAANWPTSLDGTALSNTAAWADGVDECTWRGVVCDSNGDITNIEIPNSGVVAGMNTTLAALAPAASSLLVLNVSQTASVTPVNTMAGDMSALADFTALTHLAINGTGAEGLVPDLSDSTALNYFNLYDNVGITGMGAKLAGGSAITLLGANDNPNMSGDMTATLANVADNANVTLNTTMLYGSVEWMAGDSMALAGTDIIATGGTTADHGYDPALVVQPATAVTFTEETGAVTINWLAPATAGVETGYSVSYTADDGVTLLGTTAVATGTTSHRIANITDGSYKAVVQSTGPDSRVASPAISAEFTVTGNPAPLNCTGNQVANEAGTACVDPVDTTLTCPAGEQANDAGDACVKTPVTPAKTSGGGAALWLLLLPVMGLLRRKRA